MFDSRDVKPLVIDLVNESKTKVRFIKVKLLATKSRKNKYLYCKVSDMCFKVGEKVFLIVSSMKGFMRSIRGARSVLDI